MVTSPSIKRDIKIFDGKHNYAFTPGEDMELLFDGPFTGNMNF